MAVCLTDYKLVITFADKTQKVVDVQAAQHLKLPPGAVLTLVEVATNKPPAKLLTKRLPGQLVFELEDEGVITHVLDSDANPAQVDNSVDFGPATQQAITSNAYASSEVCAPVAVDSSSELMSIGSWSFLGAGAAGAIAGASTLVSKDAGPAAATVVARVVGGPVLPGNDLQATIYKADGVSVLGTGTIGADGTVTVSVGNYIGVVVVKVTNNGTNPDYMDEATETGKDIGQAELFSIGELVREGSTIYLNVNILTALAHLKATESAGAGVPLDGLTVQNTTAAIAKAFGLVDLMDRDIQTTINQSGSQTSSNDYGKILAALSGADANNNDDIQQTLENLAAAIVFDKDTATATLQQAALTILIEGAKTADPGNTLKLVDTVSNATTVQSSSVSIGEVSVDNSINLAEKQAGVTVEGTCVAGAAVTLTLGGNVRTATVTGTTWAYTLTGSDFEAMQEGSETLLVTATLNGESVSASRGIYIDTDAPTAPVVNALLSNDTSPVIKGSNNPLDAGERLTVTVNGATYVVKPNASSEWDLDLGAATPVSGTLAPLADGQTYQVVATVTDAAGNATSDTSTNELVIDTTAPTLTLNPISDGYINNAEDESDIAVSGTSDAEDGRVVTLTLNGQTHNATVNSGVWNTTLPSSAIKGLSEGSYTLTANVSDAAGNNAAQAAQSFVYDITAPATPTAPSAYNDNVGTLQNASSTAATTDDAQPGLRVPTNLTDTLTLYVNGVAVAATYNASAGTLTPNSNLSDGPKAFTYTLTDAAGNESLKSGALNLTIDTTAPTPTAPSAYNDNVGTLKNAFSTAATTDDTRPGLRISTNLTDTPELYVNDVLVAASYNADTGELTPYNYLSDGPKAFTYTLTDAAGNVSAKSTVLNITIDTAAPNAPNAAPDLPTSSDMGDSNTDNITNIARPGLQVGALPAGVTKIELLVDGDLVAATYDAQTGLLQPTATLSDGTYAVTYRYTDAAGNQSGVSPALGLTIETVAPTKPASAPDLLSGDDSGSSDSDNNTSNNRPVFQVGSLPSNVTGIELLLDGQKVAATFNNGAIRPDVAIADGVHAVTYRHLDLAGNPSDASDALSVNIDTTAPSAAITTAAAGGINGTFEPGTSLTLTIAGQAVTGTIATNSNGSWQYVPSSTELTALRLSGTKELLLTATDTAGNTTSNSKTVSEYDFSGPYIKEFIPADTGVIANGTDGKATVNLVFSKEVVKGTGNIQLFEVDNDTTAVATIAVTHSDVVVLPGGDVFITLPGLTTGKHYYVTLAAGTFSDLAGEAFSGTLLTGTSGWDFTAAAASIAPNFVAGDDRINTAESSGTVLITGKVVSSVAILEDITAGNLTVTVSEPTNKPAVTATVVSYNKTTGEFVFSVPASAWAEGTYGYTVSLAGGTNDATGISASYTFSTLNVDLTAPTMTASVLGAQDNVGNITGDVWASGNTAVSDDTTPTLSGTLSAALSGDARVVVYRQDVTNPSSPDALVRVTNSDGLKPAGTSWSVTDSGLQDGHTYKYLAYVEDAAGNRSAAGSFKTLSIDTQAPTASVTAASLSNDTGISATDLITNVASQTVSGTLSQALAGDEKLLASLNGGATWQDITATVSGTTISLSGVTLPAGAGSVLFKVVDPAGNQGTVTTFNTTLDTTAPATPTAAPDLTANEDSGTSDTDNITNVNRPAFDVGALPTGVSGIELLVNGQKVAAEYSQSGTLQPTQALADGNQTITYRYTDAAGNQSGTSTALSLTVDTTAPTSVLGITMSDDTGTLKDDFVTQAAGQTIYATLGSPLGNGESVWGSLNQGGDWTQLGEDAVSGSLVTWENATLVGSSSIQLEVRDLAGNKGSMASQAYTLDTTAPTTTVSAIDISADTGTLSTDFLTNTRDQTITATLSAALDTGDALFGSVDAGNNWVNITDTVSGTQVNWTGASLTENSSSIELQVRDLAGNKAVTASQDYTIDTTAPGTTISGIHIDADTGPSATDFVTQTAAQKITATLSTTLATGEELFGSVNGGSTWDKITGKVTGTAISWDTAKLAVGSSSIQLAVRDEAGNAGTASTQNYTLESPLVPGYIKLTDLAAGFGGFVIDGQASGDLSGYSVSSAGDVNGDGLDDLLVGAKNSDPSSDLNNAGRSYVVFGKASGATVKLSDVAAGLGGFVIKGQSAGEQSGNSVSNVGDVNGDGLADILVGSFSVNAVTKIWDAPAYVVFGKTDTDSVNLSDISAGSGGFAISGRTGKVSVYQSILNDAEVSGAGDVNGDGLNDIILGSAFEENRTSYVVYGKSSGDTVQLNNITAASQGFVISGYQYTGVGYSTTNAGDVNGDGYADLIIGAPYSIGSANTQNGGRSYVVFGQSTASDIALSSVQAGNGGFVIIGDKTNGLSGMMVTAAGDVNGDGLADVVVSAPFMQMGDTKNKKPGEVYVVYGKTSEGAVNLADIRNGKGGFLIQSATGLNTGAGGRNGQTVSTAGDINGDGLADLILGHRESNGVYEPVYVVYGKTDSNAVALSSLNWSQGPEGFKIQSTAANHVSAAGDVNGDGLDDLIVGVSIAIADGARVGRSYVIFGASSGSAFTQSAVDWMGTTGDDTYAATAPGQTLVGDQGDDTLRANGATVLYGGAGNDTFEIDEGMINALATAGTSSGVLARVDGGTGTDTIKLLGAGQTLDMTAIANQAASGPDGGSRIDSVEVIDITGSGDNTLKLNVFDVLDMGSANLFEATGPNSGRQQLKVLGDSGDTLDLIDVAGAGTSGWTQAADVTLSSVVYEVWNHDNSLATVYVQGVLVV